jgi:large subunit ribosomal protein L29
MKPAEIRAKSIDEVRAELRDAEEELSNLRFRSAGELNNPIRLRLRRRDVARLKTILREHELGICRLASAEPDAPKS